MFKNSSFILGVFMMLAVFSSCQKQELDNRLGEQLPANGLQSRSEITSGVYAEEGYLVFNNSEALNNLREKLDVMSDVELIAYEKQSGYKSAFSHRKELLAKADMIQENGTQAELLEYLTEVSQTGYFSFEDKEFVYPFSELLAKVLSPDGKFKVGNELHRFTKTLQIVTNGSTGVETRINIEPDEILYQSETESLPTTRAVVGQEVMLRDGQLRNLFQLKKSRIDLGSGVYVWAVYLRFESYRQYALYKSERPTYFHWYPRIVKIGDSNGYLYTDIFNPIIPPQTVSNYYIHWPVWPDPAQSLSFAYYYDGQYEPTVYEVQVPDFYSDFMSNFHGSFHYIKP